MPGAHYLFLPELRKKIGELDRNQADRGLLRQRLPREHRHEHPQAGRLQVRLQHPGKLAGVEESEVSRSREETENEPIARSLLCSCCRRWRRRQTSAWMRRITTARLGRPISSAAAIGVLSWLTFYFADKTIGASSFYATLAGFVGKTVAPKHTESLPYYKDNPPAVDWGFIFVVFTIVGALDRGDGRAASSRTNGCTRCGSISSAKTAWGCAASSASRAAC